MNHQHMLQTYPGADGLKTGYIEASGFNVVTSAVHSDTRLIGVVLGAGSGWERDQHMATLLDQGFEREGVPVLMARHDPAPPLRTGQFISLAQAAPFAALSQPHYDFAGRGGHRGIRAAQAASLSSMRAAMSRRGPELRGERLHPRAIMSVLPHTSMLTPSRAAPARLGRSAGTRTANRWNSHFPG